MDAPFSDATCDQPFDYRCSGVQRERSPVPIPAICISPRAPISPLLSHDTYHSPSFSCITGAGTRDTHTVPGRLWPTRIAASASVPKRCEVQGMHPEGRVSKLSATANFTRQSARAAGPFHLQCVCNSISGRSSAFARATRMRTGVIATRARARVPPRSDPTTALRVPGGCCCLPTRLNIDDAITCSARARGWCWRAGSVWVARREPPGPCAPSARFETPVARAARTIAHCIVWPSPSALLFRDASSAGERYSSSRSHALQRGQFYVCTVGAAQRPGRGYCVGWRDKRGAHT